MGNLIIHWIMEIGWNGFLDIVFMATLIYIVLIWFNKTRAAFILKGIFIVLLVYLVARQFNLVMISLVFEKFFGVAVIMMVVIFQEEIRRFFERVASWFLNRDFGRKIKKVFTHEETEILARTLFDLARDQLGALVVLRGQDVIERHLDGGIELNGMMSAALLKSLFDPNSVGHDGAVVIVGNRVIRFSCHLPLSRNLDAICELGTRHAAGLGLAELSDALCLIVSEERGTVSAAYEGRLWEVTEPHELMEIIDRFYAKNKPRQYETMWYDFFQRTTREKVYAFLLAVGLWFVLVYGAETTYKSFRINIPYPNLPTTWVVKEIEPQELKITLRGNRRALYLIKMEDIKFNLDLKLIEQSQDLKLHADNFNIPEDIDLENIEPANIRIILNRKKKL